MPNHTRRSRERRPVVVEPGRRATHDHDRWLDDLGKRATITPAGCWQVGPDPDEYATVILYGKNTNAHRAVYEAVHQVRLDRYTHVHHECLTPACINPDHLVALSVGDHMALHAGLRTRQH